MGLDREVTTELALTPTMKFSLVSGLNGEESRSGNTFRYRTVRILNGIERTTRGEVERLDGEIRVGIVTPDGPEHQVVPPQTSMPIAGLGQAVDHLDAGATSFTLWMFAAEATSAALQLDVRQLGADALPVIPPALEPMPARRGDPGQFRSQSLALASHTSPSCQDAPGYSAR